MLNDGRIAEYLLKLDRYMTYDQDQSKILDIDKINSDINVLSNKIDHIIENCDKVDLLSKLSLRELLYTPQLYDAFVETGAYLFVIGICLKNRNESKNTTLKSDYDELCNHVIDYVDLYSFKVVAKSQKERPDRRELSFVTHSYNMLNKVNYGGYQYHFEEYVKEVYIPLDPFFDKLGISPSELIFFSNKILEKSGTKYKSILNENWKNYLHEKSTWETSNGKIETQMGISSEEVEKRLKLYSYYQLRIKLIENITSILRFKPEDIVPKSDTRYPKIVSYLNLVSCKFGDQPNFSNFEDHNMITEYPIIDLLDGTFLLPKPDLLLNHHLILENIIKTNSSHFDESIINEVRQKKKEYTENKPYELLSSIFPKGTVFKNLYYYKDEMIDKRTELDNLVFYDNHVIFLESKSSMIREPGLKGKLIKFKEDIQDIVKEGDLQINKAIEYIQFTSKPTFYDSNKNIILQMPDPVKLKFIKTVVTFVPLRGLVFDVNNNNYVNLFSREKCLVISIFDLDIICNFLNNPILFLNYFTQRSKSIRENNNFQHLGEQPFLYHFMKSLNIESLSLDSIMDRTIFDHFDNYFNFGKERPSLDIPMDFLLLLNRLEKSNIEGFSSICNILIEIDQSSRNEIIRKIEETNENMKKQKKSIWFSLAIENRDYGLTYMVRIGDNILLKDVCKSAMQLHKKNKWYGIEYSIQKKKIDQIVILV